jgi:hypothetical protein
MIFKIDKYINIKRINVQFNIQVNVKILWKIKNNNKLLKN